jgi:hypothetical protein
MAQRVLASIREAPAGLLAHLEALLREINEDQATLKDIVKDNYVIQGFIFCRF